MKINVGCGKKILDGYINVDAVKRPGVDYVCPASSLPFSDGVAREVLAIHVVEHVYSWEVPALLAEWARVLRPGGSLILEMPDILLAARNLAEGLKLGKHPDQAHMWAIYGDDTLRDPWMMHKSGWYFDRLRPLVEQAGFENIVRKDTIFHPIGRGIRDFRLEATRK
jgi:predicted SAM-dependent methyltransferase